MSRLLPSAACFVLLLNPSCRQESPSPAAVQPPALDLPASVRVLAVDEAAALLRASPAPTLLDLREDWEIQAEGRIPGSIWADFLNDERFAAAVGKLDPAQPCLLYCALGTRARFAAQKLSERGFTHLYLLEGGLEAWLQAG
ncbi:MAG: rhodanese-like domain-containing protein, partial [Prosthecobacter sp.]|nr:rhodanese-like domain-containing protein [Prosthecobacter sp.]